MRLMIGNASYCANYWPPKLDLATRDVPYLGNNSSPPIYQKVGGNQGLHRDLNQIIIWIQFDIIVAACLSLPGYCAY